MLEIKEKNASRLVIISNRLPIVIEKKEGKLDISPGSGGLVTALAPVLQNRGGLWAGWTGGVEAEEQDILNAIRNEQKNSGFQFAPIFLSKEEVEQYYYGFSNEILWPLFHDLLGKCHFVPDYWQAYEHVNAKFARSMVSHLFPSDFI